MNDKIISIDRPKCSWCGAFKEKDELSGYDPLAPVGQKYKEAHCKNQQSATANMPVKYLIMRLYTLRETILKQSEWQAATIQFWNGHHRRQTEGVRIEKNLANM